MKGPRSLASLAKQAYSFLVQVAANRDTITYQELGRKMDYPHHRLGGVLGTLRTSLLARKAPVLTALVVTQKLGRPGESYLEDELVLNWTAKRVEEWQQICRDVYKYPWGSFPAAEIGQAPRYWITTQWPYRMDSDPKAPRSEICLRDGREQAGTNLRPGDLVAVYESKNGRPLVRVDLSGKKEIVPCLPGKEGVVALLKVTGRFSENDNVEPEKYVDGTSIWWRWSASAKTFSTSGFLSRGDLNRLLGYSPRHTLRGFGDMRSGLKEVDKDVYEQIAKRFGENGVLPQLKSLPNGGLGHRTGSGEEGPLHKAIKEAVAANPSGLLKEAGLKTIMMEFPFPTGDRADILLEDIDGRVVGLEVEPTVGDKDIPGILQAIKYRYMGALMLNKKFSDSRAFLVASEISPFAREICAAYEVECFVVRPDSVLRKKGTQGRNQ